MPSGLWLPMLITHLDYTSMSSWWRSAARKQTQFTNNFIIVTHASAISYRFPKPDLSLVGLFEVCTEARWLYVRAGFPTQAPRWTGVESAGQWDTSAWESCSLPLSTLMSTPSLYPQVWVESRSSKRSQGVVLHGMREHEELSPCVSGGFPGRTSLSVSNQRRAAAAERCALSSRATSTWNNIFTRVFNLTFGWPLHRSYKISRSMLTWANP